MRFDYQVIINALPLLVEGMGVTLLMTVAAIVGGISLGAVLAVLRLSSNRAVSALAAGYVTAFRALPLLLIIFWFYFLLPLFLGRPITGFYAALVAFVLYEAAYFCEIIRSGIQGVSRGQVLAGLATGLRYRTVMRSIVLPQAIRKMVPVLLLQCINLFKSTSLVYIVGVHDFLTAVEIVGGRENRLTDLYLFAALVYFVVSYSGSRVVARLEKRVAA